MTDKNTEENVIEKDKDGYEYVTIRSKTAHNLFMRKNVSDYLKEEEYRQCSSKHSNNCNKKNGIWKEKDFFKSKNDLFDGYFPICKECLYELTSNSKGNLSKKGLAKILPVLDLPFLQDVYESAMKSKGKELGAYFRILMLNYSDLRFMDSDEGIGSLVMSASDEYDTSDIELSDELYLKWGTHYEKDELISLEYSYNRYVNAYQVEGMIEEKLIQEVCYVELEMTKARATGKDTSKLLKQFSDLLGMLKLKPDQQSSDAKKHTRLGNIAELIEQGKPIVVKDPEFEDVDHMTWYINNFFSQIFKVFGKSKIDKKEPDEKSGE